MKTARFASFFFLLAAATPAADLTGNWVAAAPQTDGTVRRTYFDLKQEGQRITGFIRITQYHYSIKESVAGPDGFAVVGSIEGWPERSATFQMRLAGDELQISATLPNGAPPAEMVAHRAPAGEGAYPARIEPPALHKVPDNGLS